jgi:hypothetical protein
LAEAAAFGDFERDVGTPLVLADGMDGDDVRVAQASDGLSFRPEPIALFGRGVLTLGDRLDRHDAAEHLIMGLVDDPHPSPSNLAEDLVSRERW